MLGSIGYALGGPTKLMARDDGRVVMRVVFTDADLEPQEHPDDEPVGFLMHDGSLLATGTPHARAIAYRAVGADGRVWRYLGERDGDSPIWRPR